MNNYTPPVVDNNTRINVINPPKYRISLAENVNNYITSKKSVTNFNASGVAYIKPRLPTQA